MRALPNPAILFLPGKIFLGNDQETIPASAMPPKQGDLRRWLGIAGPIQAATAPAAAPSKFKCSADEGTVCAHCGFGEELHDATNGDACPTAAAPARQPQQQLSSEEEEEEETGDAEAGDEEDEDEGPEQGERKRRRKCTSDGTWRRKQKYGITKAMREDHGNWLVDVRGGHRAVAERCRSDSPKCVMGTHA